MAGADTHLTAEKLVAQMRASGLRLATVESCTGGLVAGAITSVAGASDVFDRGFVTYSNAAKTAMVGVDAELIARAGAVSRDVAIAMAEGGVRQSAADLAVAITGIAGPGGATPTKPVGLVHIAVARQGGGTVHLERTYGDIGRARIRDAAVDDALALLISAASTS